MNKKVELPLVEPLYNTFNFQGPGTAIISTNPSVRNWYLNYAVHLICNRKFLHGFTTPQLTILDSSWVQNPFIDKRWISTQFTKGYINPMIREMLDQGFYVVFDGVDDFYVQGKSWYQKRHFKHDGLICGYNQEDKTYCIYAYDSNWIYRKFWTPQKAFNQGRVAMLKKGVTTDICAIKVSKETVEFSPQTVYVKLKEYLDSDLKKYPFDGEGDAIGIVVHVYIAMYLTKLLDGSIPYERMDWRVFRTVWEHKKAMLERIHLLEDAIHLKKKFGEQYAEIVAEADRMRMLYANYAMRRRDPLLQSIREILLSVYAEEKTILTALVKELGKELEKHAVGTSEK